MLIKKMKAGSNVDQKIWFIGSFGPVLVQFYNAPFRHPDPALLTFTFTLSNIKYQKPEGC